MKEKSPNEQVAANRQIDMLIDALGHAKDYSGIWLNHTGKPMPKIYEKGPSVSPFNALVLALHSDRNGFVYFGVALLFTYEFIEAKFRD